MLGLHVRSGSLLYFSINCSIIFCSILLSYENFVIYVEYLSINYCTSVLTISWGWY
jgi:hypothetical protein